MHTPYFERCPVCSEGVLVGVVVSDDQALRAMCDECESLFASPASQQPLPDEAGVRPATEEEVRASGWRVGGYL